MVAELLKNEPVYHSLLARLLGKDKKEEPIITEEKTLINFRMPLMGNVVGKSLNDIEWPCKLLIVSIERQGVEFIPTGKDIIEPGDEISVLVYYDQIECIKRYFEE